MPFLGEESSQGAVYLVGVTRLDETRLITHSDRIKLITGHPLAGTSDRVSSRFGSEKLMQPIETARKPPEMSEHAEVSDVKWRAATAEPAEESDVGWIATSTGEVVDRFLTVATVGQIQHDSNTSDRWC